MPAAANKHDRATQTSMPAQPRLLVIDCSYTFEAIRERRLEDSVTCRDLGGFFSHVWTVHPFATLLTSERWAPRFGEPVLHEINPSHSFIDGKVGRSASLARMFPLNFLLGQAHLFSQLKALVRRERIDVIRAGDPLYAGLLGWALARACGVPLLVRVGANNDKIYETTGTPILPRLMRSRRVEKIVERFVLKRADLVAAANGDNLKFALANGARADATTLFRYGNLIDKRHFQDPASRPSGREKLAELGLTPGKFILYVGRLEPVKHADDVVRVLAALRATSHDLKAVLAGEGRSRDEIAALARELGVEDRVVLAGNRDQEWLSQIIPHAAAVVSPHTGRALAEAALAAVPIVAYDIDWQSELIEDGVTGALVPHKDWGGLADAVERFLLDPAHAKAMGWAVRERARVMLDPQALDRHEQESYQALLDRAGAAR